jgi:uncharacterized protein
MRVRLVRPLLALSAAPAAAPPQAHPALWKVADADTTIYLLGTIHVLPRDYRWRDAKIDAAIASAQSLTLETVLDQDQGSVARLLVSMGRADGLPPLAARVPPARRAALAALVKRSTVPPATLDGMKTWAAAVVLTGAALGELGTALGEGVEPQLTRTFRDAGKPVDGLETPAAQLGYFDRLPESAQRAFLAATLDSPAKALADFRAMVSAWSRGDARALERSFADDPEFTPALRDLLIRQRDQAWADEIAARMAKPGTVLVAVGAGHLVGPDSVQRLLAAKGIKAVPVQ